MPDKSIFEVLEKNRYRFSDGVKAFVFSVLFTIPVFAAEGKTRAQWTDQRVGQESREKNRRAAIVGSVRLVELAVAQSKVQVR